MVLEHICLPPPPASLHPHLGGGGSGPSEGAAEPGIRHFDISASTRLWLRRLEASLQWASWAARQG